MEYLLLGFSHFRFSELQKRRKLVRWKASPHYYNGQRSILCKCTRASPWCQSQIHLISERLLQNDSSLFHRYIECMKHKGRRRKDRGFIQETDDVLSLLTKN
ncbi:hypothetical protein XELAEV_18013288mg [Xenopus laevis]|uniref:Uncharacterized protein n=1 Tax=Xenopus laevis TaxID=8355 RepID=A0A974HZA5_XENLA|nr:hypothetical protein XELAEV_18013288mg [Xenopus laevis]